VWWTWLRGEDYFAEEVKATYLEELPENQEYTCHFLEHKDINGIWYRMRLTDEISGRQFSSWSPSK